MGQGWYVATSSDKKSLMHYIKESKKYIPSIKDSKVRLIYNGFAVSIVTDCSMTFDCIVCGRECCPGCGQKITLNIDVDTATCENCIKIQRLAL